MILKVHIGHIRMSRLALPIMTLPAGKGQCCEDLYDADVISKPTSSATSLLTQSYKVTHNNTITIFKYVDTSMASPASRNPAIQEYMPRGYLGSRRIKRREKLALAQI